MKKYRNKLCSGEWTMTLFLEPITSGNVDEAIALQHTLFPHEDGSLNIKAMVDKKLFDELYEDPDSLVKGWIVRRNQHGHQSTVGMVGLYTYSAYPEDVWISWFGVLPELRRQGYGREILSVVMQKAKELGFSCIRLYTSAINDTEAVEFYSRMGMRREEYTKEEGLNDTIIIFSKSLTEQNAKPWGNRMLYLKRQYLLQQGSHRRQN